MNKRILQIVCYLSAICFVLGLCFRLNAISLSPQAVHQASMTRLHMGPAEKLELTLENDQGDILYISKLDDSTLFATAAERTWAFFWKHTSGGWTGALQISGYLDGTGATANHQQGFPLVFGITNCPGAAWVSLTVSHTNIDHPYEETLTIPVQEDGFFSQAASITSEKEYLAPENIEVYNENGLLIWSLC
ncbi:MAG: hypothetical protein ACI3U8_04555 [Candidatus Onthomonas sp.]